MDIEDIEDIEREIERRKNIAKKRDDRHEYIFYVRIGNIIKTIKKQDDEINALKAEHKRALEIMGVPDLREKNTTY